MNAEPHNRLTQIPREWSGVPWHNRPFFQHQCMVLAEQWANLIFGSTPQKIKKHFVTDHQDNLEPNDARNIAVPIGVLKDLLSNSVSEDTRENFVQALFDLVRKKISTGYRYKNLTVSIEYDPDELLSAAAQNAGLESDFLLTCIKRSVSMDSCGRVKVTSPRGEKPIVDPELPQYVEFGYDTISLYKDIRYHDLKQFLVRCDGYVAVVDGGHAVEHIPQIIEFVKALKPDATKDREGFLQTCNDYVSKYGGEAPSINAYGNLEELMAKHYLAESPRILYPAAGVDWIVHTHELSGSLVAKVTQDCVSEGTSFYEGSAFYASELIKVSEERGKLYDSSVLEQTYYHFLLRRGEESLLDSFDPGWQATALQLFPGAKIKMPGASAPANDLPGPQ